MNDEQINQLFELKKRLDSGQITQEEFDIKKNVIVGIDNSSEGEKDIIPTHENKKWIKVLLLSIIGLGTFIAIYGWNKSTSNIGESYRRVIPNTYERSHVNYVEEYAEEIEPVEEVDYLNTGNWRIVSIVNEFGEETMDKMARVDFQTYNTVAKKYNAHANILYIPSYGFEIHDIDGMYCGWSKMKVRDDDSEEIVDVKYSKREVYTNINCIVISDSASVRQFYELMLKGNITLLLNDNNVCYIKNETMGLDEVLRRNGLLDNYTLTPTLKKYYKKFQKDAQLGFDYWEKDFNSIVGVDSDGYPIIDEIEGKLDFRKNTSFIKLVRIIVKNKEDFQYLMKQDYTEEKCRRMEWKFGPSFSIDGMDYNILMAKCYCTIDNDNQEYRVVVRIKDKEYCEQTLNYNPTD